ncbi:hypothetical protein BH10CHL1_BH10CHL1_19910 [soil metagenome]
MFTTSPLLVLALYFVGHELAGAWIADTLNNVIEAVIFSSFVTAP